MTDEECERLRTIEIAARELAYAAEFLPYGNGTPADLESAWQRLLALRWNYNMDDAPRDGARIWLLWGGRTVAGAFDTRWLELPADKQSPGWFTTEEYLHPDGCPTAWMPLPPGKEG